MNHKILPKLLYASIVFITIIGCSRKNDEVQTLLGTHITEETVDDFIEKEMKSLGMPGLSIAIINDGQVVYHRVKGDANKEKQMPVNKHSIFEGASISKSVFGFFVMTFVDDGLLDLDKPLYEYLPNPDIAHDERYKKITARIVLSHRSGFPNWRDDYPDKKLFIQFEPGTKYHYSGEGYQYLAEVLKHLLNTNWAGLEEEFQKRVAIPFNMEHTKFIKDIYRKQHKVEPYDESGQWIDKLANEWWRSRDSVFVAATTIHSEAIDFSKWMIAMMNENGLTKESFKELYKPHSEISNGLLKQDYTLGFVKLSVLNIGELYTHSGNNDGFSSYFALDKDKKWGFVLFTNSSRLADSFAQRISYKLLLSGSLKKEIAIVLTFIISIFLVLSNSVLLVLKSSSLQKLRRSNLVIGLVVSLSVLSILVLMLSTHYELVKYLYPVLLIIVLILNLKASKSIIKYWQQNRGNKAELLFQSILLAGVTISGVLVGLWE